MMNQPNTRPNGDPTPDLTTDPTGVWLPVAEAAASLGLTTDAVRMRVKRNTLLSRKVDRRLQVFIERPNTDPTGDPTPDLTATQRATHHEDDPIDVPYRIDGETEQALVPVDTMLTATQALSERLSELAIEVGTLRERTSHQATEIAELRGERDQLRVEVDRLHAPPESSAGTGEAEHQDVSHTAPRPWWRFWER